MGRPTVELGGGKLLVTTRVFVLASDQLVLQTLNVLLLSLSNTNAKRNLG